MQMRYIVANALCTVLCILVNPLNLTGVVESIGIVRIELVGNKL